MTAVLGGLRAWYAGLLASRKDAEQSQPDGSKDVRGSVESKVTAGVPGGNGAYAREGEFRTLSLRVIHQSLVA